MLVHRVAVVVATGGLLAGAAAIIAPAAEAKPKVQNSHSCIARPHFEFDVDGNVVSQSTEVSCTDSDHGNQSVSTYDANGNVVEICTKPKRGKSVCADA